MQSISTIIQSKYTDDIQVAITFDDGYQNLHDIAAPILAEMNVQPMVYINSGWISETHEDRKQSDVTLGHYPQEYFLSWEEIKYLQNCNWEFGSHGVNHFNFPELNLDLMEKELLDSKQEIENRLNINCLHFAYPWGKHSTNVIKTLNKVGYQYAVAARHGRIKPNSNPFLLPRINISNEYTFDDFKNIILGKWDYLELFHKVKGL